MVCGINQSIVIYQKAQAKEDPMAKRKQKDKCDTGTLSKGAKKQKIGNESQQPTCDTQSLSLEEQVKERVTPLWNMAYEEQLKVGAFSIHYCQYQISETGM